MIKHTIIEWNIILASYIYECKEEIDQYMFDQSYDRESKELEKGTTIPYFNSNTGQWIYKLIENKEYKEIIDFAYNWWKKYLAIDKHEGITPHCLIASQHIKEYNTYNTKPGDYL